MHNHRSHRTATVLGDTTTSHASHRTNHITTHTGQHIGKIRTQTMSDNSNLILVDTILLTHLLYNRIKECYITRRAPASRWTRLWQS